MEALLEGPSYAPEKDKKGNNLKPGDKVSFKTYPKGTARGIVGISPKAKTKHQGEWVPTLVIQAHGTTYPLNSKGVLKLNESKIGNYYVYRTKKKDPIRWDSEGVMSVGGGRVLLVFGAEQSEGGEYDRELVWSGRAKAQQGTPANIVALRLASRG